MTTEEQTPRCPRCDGLGVCAADYELRCVDCDRMWRVSPDDWRRAASLDADWMLEEAREARIARAMACVYPGGVHHFEPVLSVAGERLGAHCKGVRLRRGAGEGGLMARKKHTRPRDLPHPQKRGSEEWIAGRSGRREWGKEDAARRIPKGDGTSWPAQGVGAKVLASPPKRPPILFLYPDEITDYAAPAPVFGMYPARLIPKILPWLRCERREVLHVCSGALPAGEGIRVDLRPEARPDILADGRALPLLDGSVAAVLIDPPYTEHYARELYGTDYPRPSHLLREAARVVRPGGRIGFVHYITPNPAEGTRFVTAFAMGMGFGFPMRAVTIYEREHADLPGLAPC